LDKDYRLCCNFFIILYLKEGHNKYQIAGVDRRESDLPSLDLLGFVSAAAQLQRRSFKD